MAETNLHGGEPTAQRGGADTDQGFTVNDLVPFDLTADTKQFMVGCIDPRCECRKTERVKIQTAGGAYGIATDRQLVEIAAGGSFIDIKEALRTDRQARNTSTLDIHYDCAYWRQRRRITAEMADPTPRTTNTVDFYMAEVYPREKLQDKVLGDLIAAAGVLINYVPENSLDDEDLIAFVRDELYPHHKNVHRMDAADSANTYITSHITSAGLNPKTKQRPAYFDSLGALYHDTVNHRNDFGKMLPHILGAMLLRSAATRTIINSSGKLREVDLIQVGKNLVFQSNVSSRE